MRRKKTFDSLLDECRLGHYIGRQQAANMSAKEQADG